MKRLKYWRGYGYCFKCKTHEQEPCKGLFRFFACKGRESYLKFLQRYSLILTEHYGYTILPEEVKNYENGGMNNGNDAEG